MVWVIIYVEFDLVGAQCHRDINGIIGNSPGLEKKTQVKTEVKREVECEKVRELQHT